MFGNKLGISDGEVLGITLGVIYRSELGGDEVSGQFLSDISCEGAKYGNSEDVGKDLEK